MINVKKIMTKNKDKFRDFPINRIILILQIYAKLTKINIITNKTNSISKTQVYSSKTYPTTPQTPSHQSA
jgi:hypothetical protein